MWRAKEGRLDISAMVAKLNFYYVCTSGGVKKYTASSSDEKTTYGTEKKFMKLNSAFVVQVVGGWMSQQCHIYLCVY
jgi:hypothetical protein